VDTARNRYLRSLKKDPLGRFEMKKPRQNAAWDDLKAKTAARNPAGERIRFRINSHPRNP
jgi:hypothetical protein